jgi:oxygen-independent coproporphyrinogen-3 oxidase
MLARAEQAVGLGDLERIRSRLFYGLSKYTKSFPDFSINEKFEMVSPRRSNEMFDEIKKSLADDDEYLLYIHLPFCHLECTFCNAAPRKTNGDQQRRYLSDLLQEIDLHGEKGVFEGRKLRAIFFGGGTPTIYKNESLGQILDKVRSYATFADEYDITCEAHPEGLVGNTRVAELQALGITRISCGSQSFDRRVLELCDRKSHRAQVAEVVGIAKGLGMSINVDMMIGLPGQTLDSVRADLEIVAEMMPSSVEYMRHEIVNPLAMNIYAGDSSLLVPDDDLFAMVIETQAWMQNHGYERNGCFVHERFFPFRYHWLHEVPFLGVGCRSRSYTKHLCFDTHESLEIYHSMVGRRTLPVARVMRLDPVEQMYRSVFLRLQLQEGLDVAEFTERFGRSPTDTFSELFELLEECGCIEVGPETIKLTKAGSFFVEDVCCAVIDDAVKQHGYSTTARRLPHAAGVKSLRVFQG